MDAKVLAHRVRPGTEAALVFLHGFGGDPSATWGKFPDYLGADTSLDGWDIFSLGYTTSLAPDIRGVWSADPAIPTLAQYLRTRMGIKPLKVYQALAVIAHSMGGLVVQRALLDDTPLAHRVSHVLLFGTPSNGIRKAGFAKFWKRQFRDMGPRSQFISDLRRRWNQKYRAKAGRPFTFWVVAGDQDVFVPRQTSLDPFPEADQVVVEGNHSEIVKPTNRLSMSVQVVLNAIVGNAPPGGPWNSARVAVETGHFHRAIDLLLPHVAELDEPHLVQLALALDSTGRHDDAIAVLQEHAREQTDALGVLGGRFKRRWQAEGRRADAEAALAAYNEGYEKSRRANPAQAFYHGINVAFMLLAWRRDRTACRDMAERVLQHCAEAEDDHWRAATEGEAKLYLGAVDEALETYRRAVEMQPTPRQMESMYVQASWVARLTRSTRAQRGVDRLFRGADQ